MKSIFSKLRKYVDLQRKKQIVNDAKAAVRKHNTTKSIETCIVGGRPQIRDKRNRKRKRDIEDPYFVEKYAELRIAPKVWEQEQ